MRGLCRFRSIMLRFSIGVGLGLLGAVTFAKFSAEESTYGPFMSARHAVTSSSFVVAE